MRASNLFQIHYTDSLLEQQSNSCHMQRLRQGLAQSIESSPVHLDIIRDLTQINSLLTATAYPILEASGELLRSRLRPDPQIEPVPDGLAGGASGQAVKKLLTGSQEKIQQ